MDSLDNLTLAGGHQDSARLNHWTNTFPADFKEQRVTCAVLKQHKSTQALCLLCCRQHPLVRWADINKVMQHYAVLYLNQHQS